MNVYLTIVLLGNTKSTMMVNATQFVVLVFSFPPRVVLMEYVHHARSWVFSPTRLEK